LERTEEEIRRVLLGWWQQFINDLIGISEITKDEPLPGFILARLNDETWWSTWSENLVRLLLGNLLDAARLGITTATRQLRIKLSWDYLQPTVLDWARQYVGLLISQITSDIRNSITRYIVNGLSTGRTVYEIRDEIAELRDDKDNHIFPEWRATRIARTEIIRAHAQGALVGYKSSGVVRGIRWLDGQSGACPKCRELHNKIVRLDEGFYMDPKFGDGLPPRHPHCRCAIAPITLDQVKYLPIDHPLRINERNNIQELTDWQTKTQINGFTITGERRWHYIRRHFMGYEGRPPQVKDLERAEIMLEQILQGNYEGVKMHRGALIYYREWSPRSYLVVPVINREVQSLYVKEKRQVDHWK
jgi:SPP1 gp7 family putative phage head morphogenesis protein